MPELPEVETLVRDLAAHGLIGRRIVAARVHWPRTVSDLAAPEFVKRLQGAVVRGIRRRGKFIVVSLSGGRTLLIHLRMTGQFAFARPGAKRERHEHVVLLLDDGRELRYRDTRKFGRWYLAADAAKRLDRLGPEPLAAAFTHGLLARRVGRRARMLKPLLLDQTVIAGLGNIYADEALWAARLHPERCTASLRAAELRRLHRAIRRVLRQGIECMGTTLGKGRTNFYGVAGRSGRNQDRLKVFRRVGRPCPRCRTPIVRLTVAQRSSHVCPKCQVAGQ
jgi:formamidopyrimidine-DNA glycosylase